jgi:predicted GTPase
VPEIGALGRHPPSGPSTRLLILGAAGRDFHNFNVVYRDDPSTDVLAFTAAQIPGIEGRRYPGVLAGVRYPRGIPIVPESEFERLVRGQRVDRVVLAYSDLSHEEVMHRASRALAAGADFELLGPGRTMLPAPVPVVAVSAVRTGAGKSPTALWLAQRMRRRGLRVAVLRHPMPYGDLARQVVQRFASRGDLDAANCTIEEREEYEPHLAAGGIVYSGIDTALVIARAAAEADVILWDGGNNDFPFVRTDLHVVLADALRPGHELSYHPGETCLRMADVVVISKVDAAPAGDVESIARNVAAANPRAQVVRANMNVALDEQAAVRGKRVIVVEDGPTLTHGGMAHGAGWIAARAAGAAAIVDPRSAAAPGIASVYAEFRHIGPVLPAMGYSEPQIDALRATLDAVAADVIVSATPADLAALVRPAKPVVRARYAYADAGAPGLADALDRFLAERRL